MTDIQTIYFKTDVQWRDWLEINHNSAKGIYLIFYKVESEFISMRWEDAVKVALCFGWIDSTVKSLDHQRRRQYFCPRNPKSAWSALNKRYVKQLIADNKMHTSGLLKIEEAQKNGSWAALDQVEKGIIPKDLELAFDRDTKAFENYKNFAPSYRKSYLYWLNQAKRRETREKRISEIVRLCSLNQKSRP